MCAAHLYVLVPLLFGAITAAVYILFLRIDEEEYCEGKEGKGGGEKDGLLMCYINHDNKKQILG